MTEKDWPVRKDAKHERFAQAVAKGKSLAAAYKEAGYAGDRGNATKPRAKPEIDARIQQITAKGAELAAYTIADCIRELEEIREAALDHDRPSYSVAGCCSHG